MSALTIVAPAAPGGGWDQTARVMQQVLARIEPGSSVQVENVPGAAGTIGLSRFVSAERGNPDALLVTGLVMLSAHRHQSRARHARRRDADRAADRRIRGRSWCLPASKWHTLGALIDAFKAAPASISWGGGSAGGTDDLLVRLIAAAVGASPSQVNYIAFCRRWRGARRIARRSSHSRCQWLCRIRRTNPGRHVARPGDVGPVAHSRNRRTDSS